jgi:hypothetical protein
MELSHSSEAANCAATQDRCTEHHILLILYKKNKVEFFNWPYPSSRIMALGSTQPLTEMGTRNLPGGNGRPARRADKLTAVCEPTV